MKLKKRAWPKAQLHIERLAKESLINLGWASLVVFTFAALQCAVHGVA